jgi:putative hemin transport protein
MTQQRMRRRLLACGGALLLAPVLPARAAEPEAAALARAIGPDVVLLNTAGHGARDIMRRALDFGVVMAQTGNALAVMERTGVATRLETDGDAPAQDADSAARSRNIAGGYVGGDIDLRFDFDAWRYAFAVAQPADGGRVARSLQFFDAQGRAVHKLFLRSEAAGGLFDLLARDLRAPVQRLALPPDAAPVPQEPRPEPRPDSAIDVRRLRQAWQAMEDIGQLGAVMAEFGVTREQALRLAPQGMAPRLAPRAVRTLLEAVAKHRLPLVVLVGNAGVTQVYTGVIAAATADGADFTAQAPGFSLRLSDSAFHSGYVVQRAGGASVEFFGPEGDPVVTFVGMRDRAQPLAWGELVKSLPRE